MAVDRALVDTNVFLAATDTERHEHLSAMTVLNDWPSSGTVLYTSGQVWREYLVAATRPASVNGLGLPVEQAVDNVRAMSTKVRLIEENARVVQRLIALLGDGRTSGKQIHDANLVATMLVHGVSTIITANPADFRRFEAHVDVLSLLDV